MVDIFEDHKVSMRDPVVDAIAITPSDTDALPQPTRVLYVGSHGDVRITLARGTAPVLLRNLAVGWHPVRAIKVHQTGTTAADLVGGW